MGRERGGAEEDRRWTRGRGKREEEGQRRARSPESIEATRLLLLLLLSSELSGTQDCSFQFSPISSDFAVKIRELVSGAAPTPS
ncbi:hypothetical protein P7K49_034822 [Saguinus oedipus]|uniref:Uncharacterized protein n=1 Tax=Saguinus oedipus TaxID=9490 RepID=A0ABQ9TWQ4_SAGOE|nr:hypothetical protein P7K49_034822 [Saguinus oedipus]